MSGLHRSVGLKQWLGAVRKQGMEGLEEEIVENSPDGRSQHCRLSIYMEFRTMVTITL